MVKKKATKSAPKGAMWSAKDQKVLMAIHQMLVQKGLDGTAKKLLQEKGVPAPAPNDSNQALADWEYLAEHAQGIDDKISATSSSDDDDGTPEEVDSAEPDVDDSSSSSSPFETSSEDSEEEESEDDDDSEDETSTSSKDESNEEESKSDASTIVLKAVAKPFLANATRKRKRTSSSESPSSESSSSSSSSSSEDESESSSTSDDTGESEDNSDASSSSSESSSDSDSSDSEASEEETKRPKKVQKTSHKPAQDELKASSPALSRTLSPPGPTTKPVKIKVKSESNTPSSSNGIQRQQRTYFSRVKDNVEVHPHLASNEYNAGTDNYGAKANQDLIVTRGDGFRKEKQKKKRGSYRGGTIDFQTRSFKFED